MKNKETKQEALNQEPETLEEIEAQIKAWKVKKQEIKQKGKFTFLARKLRTEIRKINAKNVSNEEKKQDLNNFLAVFTSELEE